MNKISTLYTDIAITEQEPVESRWNLTSSYLHIWPVKENGDIFEYRRIYNIECCSSLFSFEIEKVLK